MRSSVCAIGSTHEEADTRLVLHCSHTDWSSVVVWCRDTDVLLMLMEHSTATDKIVYMKAGTSKFIPANDILRAWGLRDETAWRLLPFHALTGSNTTSFLAYHSTKTALEVFWKHNELISNLGTEPLTMETIANCDRFICTVYNIPTASTTNEVRSVLFRKAVKPDFLPPPGAAVKQHIKRGHLQSMIWLNALQAEPQISAAVEGWMDGREKTTGFAQFF